jgi:DNA-binding transcriptional ArsR family regulator
MNQVFKALADPTRRKILEYLKEEDLNAGEIADKFNISKPSITHHLNALKEAELVFSEKVGQNVIYSLNTTVFQEAIKWFFDFTRKDEEHER